MTTTTTLEEHLARKLEKGWFPTFLRYPVKVQPRWGYGKPAHPGLTALFEQGRERYMDTLLGFLESDEREVDLRGVRDLESFLQAALLQPHSLTADFRFPHWCEGEVLRRDERLTQLRELVPACA